MTMGVWLAAASGVAGGTVVWMLGRRLVAWAVTARARAWTPLLLRYLSRAVGARDYTPEEFLRADDADDGWVERRRQAFGRLATQLRESYPQSLAWSQSVREGLSDLRFADATRVPFPFVRVMRDAVDLGGVVTASNGPWLQNLDGGWTLDVSGSYGLNVCGFDRYKEWMAAGLDRVHALGPVLGPLHPIVADNVARLKALSGLDEVSFHMSGTEAVMAAVRLARFNTGRRLIVCFSGAYHGWWDGVQPGLGSERAIDDCLTLSDMSPASLSVIRTRAREIAAVLVNPAQSFHPNAPPPNDAVLLTSNARQTRDSTDAYADWLRRLRGTCAGAGVPLILDEVYTGFRLAPGGAQEYFGVAADMVIYGKTVAGGLPIGVVCGTHALMRRFDPARPMRMAYIVGTFSAHPVVMGAMQAFLQWVVRPESAAQYRRLNERCREWARVTNERLAADGLPLRIAHLASIWTAMYTEPSRFNWLLQYYLRAAGLTLSWVGTGRCLISMDFSAEDLDTLATRVVEAARSMKRDGWWLTAAEHPRREQRMRARVIKEVVGSVVRIPASVTAFYEAVMTRKRDDHAASHSHRGNQVLHLVSSSVFIVCYALIFRDLTTAMSLGLAALFVRQLGHAVLEPPCHDAETLLLGFTTRAKSGIVFGYAAIFGLVWTRAGGWAGASWASVAPLVALYWFRWTLAVVLGRVVYLAWKHDFRISMIWFVKLVTDPFTDLLSYRPWRPQGA